MTAPTGVSEAELAALLDKLVPPVAPQAPPRLACTVCGERLDPVLAEAGTHLMCDPEPAAPATPPPTLVDLAHALRAFDANRPRNTQVAIGPSQIAVRCDRRLTYSLMGIGKAAPSGRVAWEPMVGTAVHAMIAEALQEENARLGRERWLIERRVHPDTEISGSCDAYDTDHDCVIDWKVVGDTTLKSVRPGPQTPDRQPSSQYIGQIQLYARGWQRAGRNPRWVRIVFLPRAGGIAGAYEWTAPYDRLVADGALERLYRLRDLAVSLDLASNTALWATVPATPDRLCGWCPYHRDGGPADDTGCPGDVAAKERSGDRYEEGLIAP